MKPLPILIAVLAIGLTFCTDVEDPDPPVKPRLVEKSSGFDTLTQGIHPSMEQNAIVLQWYRNPDPDLAGYVIFRAADTTIEADLKFETLDSVWIFYANPTLLDSEYIDINVELAMPYLYYIRAIDDAGNESKPSDTARYTLAVKPSIESPKNGQEDLAPQPLFSWKYTASFQFSVDFFFITLENMTTNELVWRYATSRNRYDGTAQSVPYNTDGSASESSLSSEYLYRWRLDAYGMLNAQGIEREGARSPWIFFKVKGE
ncbi:MAG TPA: hypothetical protein ENN84_03185 [Candidatus Marinimicrobia bacterium]|nr:hypothetical protein [Candidatus Neomarinimicrobiota bacterium]